MIASLLQLPMTSSPSTGTRGAALDLLHRLRFLTAFVGACAAASAHAVVVDYNKANDYYAALPTGRVNVVDQYHLGPCEKRLNERDYQRGMNECNFILKIFPNHPNALLLMSRICEQWKSPKCMLDDYFRSAIAINPEAPKTYVIIGIYLHDVKQYDKAIESYKRALQLDPNDMNAHYNLALTYLKTDRFDLANAHAQRAYALGASLPGLRNMLEKSGHWDPNAPKLNAASTSDVPAETAGSAPAKDAVAR
jgi:tetratricopeptide (TPR) repeat protein